MNNGIFLKRMSITIKPIKMKRIILSVVLTTFVLFSYAQKPTEVELKEAIRNKWERKETSVSPKKTIVVNNIKIGTSGKATALQQKSGVPQGALVTHAKVYFNETSHNPGGGKVSKKEMRVWVYNENSEWKVKVLEVVSR
jgi:hypothetical protein